MEVNNTKDLTYIGIDIGGTWIKGISVGESFFANGITSCGQRFDVRKIESPLSEGSTDDEVIKALHKLIGRLIDATVKIGGIGISTAGIVDYAGKCVLKTAAHLSALKNNVWIKAMEEEYNCPIVLINDADAATIGATELGLLNGNNTIGIMPIGTGLGFSVWRNGRRWRPGKVLSLLGSIRTPSGFYDGIASASRLATEDPENNLIEVLTQASHKEAREKYLNSLVKIINTAAIIYNLSEVMVCGGLADAANVCSYPLESKLNSLLAEQQVELDKVIRASVVKEGNKLQLLGAVSLAKGESVARARQVKKTYKSIPTEIPYQKDLQLQDLSTSEVVKLFWKAEQETGECLEKSFPFIEHAIDEISYRIKKRGRLIYVGSGTSGRIAAMDAVEIPCTYGFPEERILCLIAGGVADAAIEIESDFEEDASAVPEMLLLNISPQDVVVGISASGTAYYVQSALALAKARGAYSVMIQSEKPQTDLPFCDIVIPLNSGYEVVAGSTRMKAGTATKKILNIISSSLMIKMGKVAGSYMVDVACINNKLIERAQSILGILYNMDKKEAYQLLKESGMNLKQVINKINNQK
uniref:N-acetylmuramic acid 6-phosphate etherase n=1 Tax=uncultured Draconibacterium sp. TaxID=1573823 RepID=UPI0032177C56